MGREGHGGNCKGSASVARAFREGRKNLADKSFTIQLSTSAFDLDDGKYIDIWRENAQESPLDMAARRDSSAKEYMEDSR